MHVGLGLESKLDKSYAFMTPDTQKFTKLFFHCFLVGANLLTTPFRMGAIAQHQHQQPQPRQTSA